MPNSVVFANVFIHDLEADFLMEISDSDFELISPFGVFASILVDSGFESSSCNFHHTVGVHFAEGFSVSEESALPDLDLEHSANLDLGWYCLHIYDFILYYLSTIEFIWK